MMDSFIEVEKLFWMKKLNSWLTNHQTKIIRLIIEQIPPAVVSNEDDCL